MLWYKCRLGGIPTKDKCQLGSYLQKTNVGWGHTYNRLMSVGGIPQETNVGWGHTHNRLMSVGVIPTID